MDIGTLLFWVIGILVVGAIVWAIIMRLGLPPEVIKWVIVGFLVVLLIIAIQFFFRGGAGVIGHV